MTFPTWRQAGGPQRARRRESVPPGGAGAPAALYPFRARARQRAGTDGRGDGRAPARGPKPWLRRGSACCPWRRPGWPNGPMRQPDHSGAARAARSIPLAAPLLLSSGDYGTWSGPKLCCRSITCCCCRPGGATMSSSRRHADRRRGNANLLGTARCADRRCGGPLASRVGHKISIPAATTPHVRAQGGNHVDPTGLGPWRQPRRAHPGRDAAGRAQLRGRADAPRLDLRRRRRRPGPGRDRLPARDPGGWRVAHPARERRHLKQCAPSSKGGLSPARDLIRRRPPRSPKCNRPAHRRPPITGGPSPRGDG